MPLARKELGHEAEHCLDVCQSLHDACLHTASGNLKRGGPYAAAHHLNLLFDCAAATQITRDFLLRHSTLTLSVSEACAIICLFCAKTCLAAAHDDLAALCYRCARACRSLCSSAA